MPTNHISTDETEQAHDVVRHGRLSGTRNADIASLLSSMEADRYIASHDVRVDIAHLLMLADCSITSRPHAQKLMRELIQLYDEGVPQSVFNPAYEDIHAGIESHIIAMIGMDSGGRLHVARSRNDEVATCLRLYARSAALAQIESLLALRLLLLELAQEHLQTIMPGFTHLQHAQPTTLAHHMLAYEQMFARDTNRLLCAYEHINASPLGAAAFASTGYPIDREQTSRDLGFQTIVENSMDAVSSRDFACELLSADTILEMHISRLCEELIIWNSGLTRFVELDDAYCSTSSIMPQKKNPDVAELLRSRTGTLLGAFTSAITIMKALPLTYNRDLQDLNPHLFSGTKHIARDLRLLAGMLQTAKFQKERMHAQAGEGYSTATGLADYLVCVYDIPFREAHNIIGRAVRADSLQLQTLDLAAQEITGHTLSEKGLTKEEIDRVLDPAYSVSSRSNFGGPAPSAVKQALKHRKEIVKQHSTEFFALSQNVSRAEETLIEKARQFIQENKENHAEHKTD
ncbi:MAG: argininosuccinate lyase [Methanomicrobiales archaeon]|jgi:argininosuccinate lyase|nr:argininosuccinate lyase [Methanomicrobiales archaeon]